MDKLSNLKPGAPKYDTTLAEGYLEDNKIFKSITKRELVESQKVNITPSNVVVYTSKYDPEDIDIPVSQSQAIVHNLIQTVIDNSKLISQLAYLVKGTPVNEAEEHVNLIVQLLSVCLNKKGFSGNEVIIIDGDTPLFALACVGYNIAAGLAPKLVVIDPYMAPVCHLFTKLCREADLDTQLMFMTEEDYRVNLSNTKSIIYKANVSCAGVVTERSDLDSAVDAFIGSAVASPWKLSRILVQESIYEDFKKAMSWKCRDGTQGRDIDSLRPLCAELYAKNGKIFLLDYTGVDVAGHIAVEAYRTNKELLGFLENYKPQYLSLWCAGRSESDEIAYNAPSTVVWVNSYAVFNGPPIALEAVSGVIDLYKNSCTINTTNAFVKTTNAWIKLNKEQRLQVLRGAFENIIKDGGDDKNTALEYLHSIVYNWKSNSFVELIGNTVWVGVEGANGFCLVEKGISLAEMIKLTVYGNAIVCSPDIIGNRKIYDCLAKAGVPISIAEHFDCTVAGVEIQTSSVSKMKIVASNFGTIFAN